MTSQASRYLARAMVLLIIGGCLGGALAGCGQRQPPVAPPPVEVAAITVHPKTVPFTVPYMAQVRSSHQVDVEARGSGYLRKICYAEGTLVRQDQVLFELEKKPFQVAAEEARADVEMRRAELFKARANLDRIKPLAEQNAASKKNLDDATSDDKSAEAALLGAQAKYDKALLDVGYATITSPVDGVAGQALVREGSYLTAGTSSAKLTTVNKMDPVWVEFSVSQNQQEILHQEFVEGRLLMPKDGRFTVALELGNGVSFPYTGVLTFFDKAYRQETASYLVRAEIPNPISATNTLLPGMFVKACLKGAQRPNVMVVPQRAVRQGANGHEVLVANEKDQAEVRPVIAGDWVGQDWVITHGLKPGDRVIVDGFQTLAPGTPLKVVLPEQPTVPPSPQPAAN